MCIHAGVEERTLELIELNAKLRETTGKGVHNMMKFRVWTPEEC